MKPIIQKRDKNLSVSVFVNKTEDGKSFTSFTLQRSYKKKGEEEWTRETIHLDKKEVLPCAQILSNAYSEDVSKEALPKLAQTDRNSYEVLDNPLDNTDIPF